MIAFCMVCFGSFFILQSMSTLCPCSWLACFVVICRPFICFPALCPLQHGLLHLSINVSSWDSFWSSKSSGNDAIDSEDSELELVWDEVLNDLLECLPWTDWWSFDCLIFSFEETNAALIFCAQKNSLVNFFAMKELQRCLNSL